MSPVEPFLTTAQAADRLGLSEYQVQQAYRSGVLPSRRVGRLVRFTEADLEQFQANTKAKGSGLTARSRARRRT